MVDQDMVRVMGRSAFHDTGLISSAQLCYLGGEVRKFNPNLLFNISCSFFTILCYIVKFTHCISTW